jgi:uncharacterized protein (DUF2062 family)
MSNYWNNQLMYPASELITAMTGSTVLIGTLLQRPVKLILDNQSTAAVILYISYDLGTTLIQFHTFPAGEAMIIDDDLYTISKGASFYGNGAASGSFSISYFFTKE